MVKACSTNTFIIFRFKGRVIGFFDSWVSQRLWPVDMAGFAVALSYLERNPNATMPYKAGFEEDGFLKSIGLKMDDIEPKANNCTEVLVWHTQTKKAKTAVIRIDSRNINSNDSSLGALLRALEAMGVSHINQSSGKYQFDHHILIIDSLKTNCPLF